MIDLKTPAIVVNFKAYREVDGDGSLKLAQICESVSKDSGVSIAVCPPMVELGTVARAVDIPVFAQNADPHAPGSSTGWVTASMIKSTGAVGTLINHSEHRFENNVISESVELAKADDLITMVCAESVKKATSVATFHPDFIAIEPPELIGGDISVTTANPLIIEDTVNSVRSVNKKVAVLCGAGVKTGEDVAKAIDLGAAGVLLASGVVKSKDPKATLYDLIKHI